MSWVTITILILLSILLMGIICLWKFIGTPHSWNRKQRRIFKQIKDLKFMKQENGTFLSEDEIFQILTRNDSEYFLYKKGKLIFREGDWDSGPLEEIVFQFDEDLKE